MTYKTDERLKGFLDTNQLAREQMCLQILRLDERFSEIKPRHPRGGPDGGRDIDARYRQEQLAYGAVGFVNQANDSDGQKKKIKKKFNDDCASALSAEPRPSIFVFFTNLNLTSGEKDALVAKAKAIGFAGCYIFDREQIRIRLDGVDGFSIRYQCLEIPLSNAEQASFFARWGDGIQSLIAGGFQRMERSLDRILFLQESEDRLINLTFNFELDRLYDADEINHFRAFCLLHLKEIKNDVFGILFGRSDKSERMRSDLNVHRDQKPGIRHGISSGQWEMRISSTDDLKSLSKEWTLTGSGSSIGEDCARTISISYRHDHLIIIEPGLRLKDLDRASFMPIVDFRLATKLKRFHVYANGYKLSEINSMDLKIDKTNFDPKVPVKFTENELENAWIRIRPSCFASSFDFDFHGRTPRKLYSSDVVVDSLSERQ